MRFFRELRYSSGGSLTNMTLQEMVGGVAQMILDHQVRWTHRPETHLIFGHLDQRQTPLFRSLSSLVFGIDNNLVFCHQKTHHIDSFIFLFFPLRRS